MIATDKDHEEVGTLTETKFPSKPQAESLLERCMTQFDKTHNAHHEAPPRMLLSSNCQSPPDVLTWYLELLNDRISYFFTSPFMVDQLPF